MSTWTHHINQAVVHQPLREFLQGTVNFNPVNKNVYSAQNSLADPSCSTAGAYCVGGIHCTNAASSSAFTLTDTSIPAYGGACFILCYNATGTGVGYPTNVLTSAQLSTHEITTAAGLLAILNKTIDTYGIALQTPNIPSTQCPVGIYTVIAGAVSHVAGSSTFSAVDSAGGSHLFTNIMTLNKVSE
jgi:hypothetical protein